MKSVGEPNLRITMKLMIALAFRPASEMDWSFDFYSDHLNNYSASL